MLPCYQWLYLVHFAFVASSTYYTWSIVFFFLHQFLFCLSIILFLKPSSYNNVLVVILILMLSVFCCFLFFLNTHLFMFVLFNICKFFHIFGNFSTLQNIYKWNESVLYLFSHICFLSNIYFNKICLKNSGGGDFLAHSPLLIWYSLFRVVRYLPKSGSHRSTNFILFSFSLSYFRLNPSNPPFFCILIVQIFSCLVIFATESVFGANLKIKTKTIRYELHSRTHLRMRKQ